MVTAVLNVDSSEIGVFDEVNGRNLKSIVSILIIRACSRRMRTDKYDGFKQSYLSFLIALPF